MKKKEIKFRSIPGVEGGYTALSIRPPGAWFHSPDYVVFVGGCGVTTTLKEAKTLLLIRAKETCVRRILEAQKVSAHYERALKMLGRGLRRCKDGH